MEPIRARTSHGPAPRAIPGGPGRAQAAGAGGRRRWAGADGAWRTGCVSAGLAWTLVCWAVRGRGGALRPARDGPAPAWRDRVGGGGGWAAAGKRSGAPVRSSAAAAPEEAEAAAAAAGLDERPEVADAAPGAPMGGCVGAQHDSSGSLNENSEGTGVALGRNQPLKKEKPKWKSDYPMTDGQLRSKRDEFWDTAPAFEGRKEIWDALKAAAHAFESNDHELAQAIIDGANITLPHGRFSVPQGQRGHNQLVYIIVRNQMESICFSCYTLP
ncbi:ubiquitin domain-containing protein 2 [Choloepus didactylus]|uniref:ubiquitin domain-containing protein 2 n=1 Tax=Choloepus didactylus TaxID=27675 RepID=UPI0018A11642|nr:ubiquitin domain-containing protein 2 [Choloepus didactylus]